MLKEAAGVPIPDRTSEPGGRTYGQVRRQGSHRHGRGLRDREGQRPSLRLAEEGTKVVLTDISKERGNGIAREIKDAGGKATFVRHDVVTEEDQWPETVASAREAYGGVDVLHNNAGIYVIRSLAETTVEKWNNLVAINVMGVFFGMKPAAPVMSEAGGGSIVSTSPVTRLTGVACHILYGSFEGAVKIMTEDATTEYASAQVRIDFVHPGYTSTKMAEYGATTAGTTTEGLGRSLLPPQALRRAGRGAGQSSSSTSKGWLRS